MVLEEIRRRAAADIQHIMLPEGEDPRLKRLEAQIEALREQLEALGRGRKEG